MKKLNINKIGSLLLVVALCGFTACKTGSRYSRSSGEVWDDRTISHNVKNGFGNSSLLKEADIDVQTFRGNVSLYGFVDHPAQKVEASAITRGTAGVRWFQNNLIVKDEIPETKQSGQRIMTEPAGSGGGQWEKGAFNQGTSQPNSQGQGKSSTTSKEQAKPSTESGKAPSENADP